MEASYPARVRQTEADRSVLAGLSREDLELLLS